MANAASDLYPQGGLIGVIDHLVPIADDNAKSACLTINHQLSNIKHHGRFFLS